MKLVVVGGDTQQQKIKGIRARRKKICVRDGLVWSSKEQTVLLTAVIKAE